MMDRKQINNFFCHLKKDKELDQLLPLMDINQVNDLYKDFLEENNNDDMSLVLNNIEDCQLKELFEYCKMENQLDKLMSGIQLLSQAKITGFFQEFLAINDKSSLNLLLEQMGNIPNNFSVDILNYAIEYFNH